MNKLLFNSGCLLALLFIADNTLAAAISQCIQPDGTIEFTNKGCSKSNSFYSRKTYNRNSSQSLVTKVKSKSNRSRSAFMRSDFIQLNKKLLHAETPGEIELHAQTITDRVRIQTKQGKLKSAYNMIASTYAKISKDVKKKRWDGQPVNSTTLKIRSLFEEILITQSSISTINELNLTIEAAWKKYQGENIATQNSSLSGKIIAHNAP